MNAHPTKIPAYKTAVENRLKEKGVPIYDGTQPKERWKRFVVLSGNPDAPDPGYGLVESEVPVEDLLQSLTENLDILLSTPDTVRVAHAQVQVYADLLTDCIYDVRVGLTFVPVGDLKAEIEAQAREVAPE
jgi:hypothetical protein